MITLSISITLSLRSHDFKFGLWANTNFWLNTLYGLKQSPREWNEVIHKFLISENFKQSQADSCIYVKRKNENVIFVGVYVDDIISIGQGKFLEQFRTKMQEKFQMIEQEF